MRIATLAGVASVATLLTGCGAGHAGSAGDVPRETATHIKDIRSGVLALRLMLEPRSADVAAGRLGFMLEGPVDLRAQGLPVARLRYTQIAGRRQAAATLISTGRAAFVQAGGITYRLPRDSTAALRESSGGVRAGVRLPVGRWIRDARTTDGGTVGGARTDHVAAKLDVVAALRYVFDAARRAGIAVPDLGGARADDLRRAVDEGSLDVWSGHEDHLLRRLRLRIGLRASPPPRLRRTLGTAAGARLRFDVDIAAPNRPVRVTAPADARAAPEWRPAGRPR